MKNKILLCVLSLVFSGCASTMNFEKVGNARPFQDACEECKGAVKTQHPYDHPPYPGYSTADSMTGIGVELLRGISGYTWKDVENFQECMKRRGWFITESKEVDSSVILDGSWDNLILKYPSSGQKEGGPDEK